MVSRTTDSISVLQLGVVVLAATLGGQLIITSRNLIKSGGEAAWISVIAGGIVYGLVAVMMIKIGRHFPNDTFVEYMPKIWGKFAGGLIILWFYLLFIAQAAVILQGFGKFIKYFMFDKTPQIVIPATMVLACAYCALHKINIIVKVLSILAVLTTPVLGVWLLALQNFNAEMLLPIIPFNWPKFAQGLQSAWNVFAGYEIIMVVLPLVSWKSPGLSPETGVVWTFAILTVFFAVVIAIIIGVLGAEQAALFTAPAVTVIKGVEVPGTFAERLENLLMIFWIPLVFDTIVVFMYTLAKVVQIKFSLQDHRPALVMQIPIIFFLTELNNHLPNYEIASKYIMYAGIVFSLIVIPLSLLMVLWKQRSLAGDGYEQ